MIRVTSFLQRVLQAILGARERRPSFESLLDDALRDREGAALRIEALERALAALPEQDAGNRRTHWH